MASTRYVDLAEFGLPLVPAGDHRFTELVRGIRERAEPEWLWPKGELDPAAVLLNESGRAIVVLTCVWRYTTANGQVRTGSHSNLGSSTQIEVLSRRAEVARDLSSFILPGSKRLITEQGTFGSNLDVLPEGFPRHRGGWGWGGVGGGLGERSPEAMAGIELILDAAILEDGLCLGPDEGGLVEGLTHDLEQQRMTARRMVEAMRNGASPGRIFEILQPLASHHPAPGSRRRGLYRHGLLQKFANMAIHRLTHGDAQELLDWFEIIAQSMPLPLHRP